MRATAPRRARQGLFGARPVKRARNDKRRQKRLPRRVRPDPFGRQPRSSRNVFSITDGIQRDRAKESSGQPFLEWPPTGVEMIFQGDSWPPTTGYYSGEIRSSRSPPRQRPFTLVDAEDSPRRRFGHARIAFCRFRGISKRSFCPLNRTRCVLTVFYLSIVFSRFRCSFFT